MPSYGCRIRQGDSSFAQAKLRHYYFRHSLQIIKKKKENVQMRITKEQYSISVYYNISSGHELLKLSHYIVSWRIYTKSYSYMLYLDTVIKKLQKMCKISIHILFHLK